MHTLGLAEVYEITDWADGPAAWRLFRIHGDSLPHQGWKIHVSSSAAEFTAMLARVTAVLAALRASFKTPRTAEGVVLINSGDAGATQLGKVVTAYPVDDRHAAELISRLDAVWPLSRGPEVLTDLHVRPGSAVSFRYGVYGTGPVVTSATGEHRYALRSPTGKLAPDARDEHGRQAATWAVPPVPGVPPGLCPVQPGRTVAVGGRRYAVLHRMNQSARASVFLGADRETLSTVAIKVGRPGVCGGLDGRDIRDQLEGEFHILRVLAAGLSVAPAALAWSPGPWPTLVMEDLRGPLLSELAMREPTAALPGLAHALASVHAAGIVHGDIKLDNTLLTRNGVRLFDFELAARGGEPMRRGGTPGHLPPEAADGVAADPARDVYALAGCVFHAVMGTPPALLPSGIRRQVALLLNEGHGAAAALVGTLGAEDPRDRPTAAAAASMLETLAARYAVGTPRRRARRVHAAGPRALRRWSARAAASAATLVDTYARADGASLCWRNTHAMRDFDCEGINLGAAGIVLGLVTIDHALGRGDMASQVAGGARWLAARSPVGQGAGLFTGNAGVALALCVAGRRLGNPELVKAGRVRYEHAAGNHRELDLFSGCAGVVWAGCLLADVLAEPWPIESARPALDRLAKTMTTADRIPFWSADPQREAQFLGCAHGSAGVAMALGAIGAHTSDAPLTKLAIDTFGRIAAHGRTDDGGALRMTADGSSHHAIGNWCHGVAGYLWCILQGLGDHQALRREIDWAVALLGAAPCAGTPTYCHGLAGQLELWRMVGELPRHRRLAQERVCAAAAALRAVHHKAGGRCAWIADNPDVTTPDLWVGFLGPASALAMHACGAGAPLLSGRWLRACATATATSHRSPTHAA